MSDKPKELEEHSAQIFELGLMERPVYLKEDVDAVIAGLKQKLQDQCISCPVKMQEDDVVAELKAECEKLKAQFVPLYEELKRVKDENENLKNNLFVVENDIAMATAYAESVDAGMRERRLKRALWLARAERYKMREFIAREEGNLCNQMSWSSVLRERTYDQWVDQLLRIANLANKLQNKCLNKSKEYL